MKKTLLALAMLTAYTSGAYAASPAQVNNQTNITIGSPGALYDAAQTFTGAVTSGYFGVLTANTKVNVTATFLGYEAGHNDIFNLGGSQLLNTSVGASVTKVFNAGTITFSFTDPFTSNSSPNPATASNGALFNTSNYKNTFAFLNPVANSLNVVNAGHYDYLIGYNDKGNDKDFDDFVVGIKVSAVPEPETFAMMISGLGLVGFASSRRRIKS